MRRMNSSRVFKHTLGRNGLDAASWLNVRFGFMLPTENKPADQRPLASIGDPFWTQY
jgi:hypothetical protein